MNEYPDLSLFLQNLWLRENAIGLEAIEGKGGYSNGKYYPYKTPNGNIDVGPGFDMDKQTSEFRERAAKGFTKEELDNMVLSIARNELPYFRRRIIREGGNPDKVIDAVYNGLLDMYWQLNNGLYGYDNFWKAVASGDYEGMRNESATYYSPKNGKIPKDAIVKDGKILDTGRWEFRKNNYFKDPEILNSTVNDAVVQTSPIMEPAFDESMYVERPDVIRDYKPVVFPSNTRMDVRRGMQNKIDFNNFMDSIRIQNNLQTYNFPIQFNKDETTKDNQYDKGGSLNFPQWDNLSIREKAAMMRTAVSNGITNIDDIKREYNEFAEGGPKKSWTMEDEANYRQWRNSLPDNLKYTDDNIYDIVGAYQAGMQPTLEDDGKYHLGSRDPQTGKILKAPYHPTYLQALNEDARMGYYPTLTTDGTYTDTWKGNIPKEIQVPYRPYAKGGNLFDTGGPTRKEIEELFWQNRMDEAQAALNQVPQKASTPIIDRELPELTVYPQRNYPDPYSIPQGEITPITGNALTRAINNYTGELKYDLANNRVPSGKYLLPAAVLGAAGLTGAASLPAIGEAYYAAGLSPLIMEGLAAPYTAHGLDNLVHGNADWQTALEIAPLAGYAKPVWNTGKAVYNAGKQLISDAYNWRPVVPSDPNRYYRMVGSAGNPIEDAIESGVIRGPGQSAKAKEALRQSLKKKPGSKVTLTPKVHEYPMFSKGDTWGGSTSMVSKEKPIVIRSKADTGPIKWEESNIDFDHKGHPNIFRPSYNGDPNASPINYFEYWEPRKFGYVKREFPAPKTAVPENTLITTPQITAENAASITPEQWTAAQDAAIAKTLGITPEEVASLTEKQWNDAIAKGINVDDIQRLRDLHFKINAPNSAAIGQNGLPLDLLHGTRTAKGIKENGFSKAMSGKGNRGANEGHIYLTNSRENAEYTGVKAHEIEPLIDKVTSVYDLFNSKNIPTLEQIYAQSDDLIKESLRIRDQLGKLHTGSIWDKTITSLGFKNSPSNKARRLQDIIRSNEKRVDELNRRARIVGFLDDGLSFMSGNRDRAVVNTLNFIHEPINPSSPYRQIAANRLINAMYGTTDQVYSPGVIRLYGNFERPLLSDFKMSPKDPNPLKADRLSSIMIDYNNKEASLLKELAKPEYDSSISKNKFDVLFGDVYISKNPNNLKSAEAVTFDKNGVRVPLGERDNFNINDIRYALLPTLGIGAMGTLYNQKSLGGNLFADGGIIYDGGTLPELAVVANANKTKPETTLLQDVGNLIKGGIAKAIGKTAEPPKVYKSLTGRKFNTRQEAAEDNWMAVNRKGIYADKPIEYTVKKGDSMWKISHENGIDLNTIRKLNPNVKNDLIHPGDKVIVGTKMGKQLYNVKKEWEKEKILNTDNLAAIQSIKHSDNYIVIDKLNNKLSVYDKNNNLIYQTDDISTGKSGNDYNTITYVNDEGHIISGKGNESTPAGITKITGVGTYEGYPAFIRGRNSSKGLEDVASSLHFGRTKDKRASNGCVRIGGKTLNELSAYIGTGTDVYTLPEKRGSRFTVKDGKLNFTADDSYGVDFGFNLFKAKAREKYENEEDYQEAVAKEAESRKAFAEKMRKDPVFAKKVGKRDFDTLYYSDDYRTRFWDDYNVSMDKSYSPLSIISKSKSDGSRKYNNEKKYIQTLENSKERLQKKFNLDSDTYNRLASMALGIAEQETKFGTASSYDAKVIGRNVAGDAFMDYAVNPLGRAVRQLKNGQKPHNLLQEASRGYSQIKLTGDNDEMRDIYESLGITSDNIDSADSSALATLARLAYMYNNEVKDGSFIGANNVEIDPYDALMYKWMGRNAELIDHTATPELNNYIQNVKKYQDNYNMYTLRALGGNLYPNGGSLNPSVLRAMKYFMDRGFTDYQAAGFVGNLMRESSMDPNALNKWSNAFGLAQWLGDRRNALFAMYGPKPTFEQQLDFIWHELNTTHKNGLKYILASKDAEEAARNTMGYYEFSAGPEGAIAAMNKHKQNGQASMDRGIEFAKQFYGYYNPMSLEQQKPQDPVLAANSTFNVNPMDNTYVEKPRYYDIPMSTPVNEQYSPEVLAREQAKDNLNTLATVLGILDTHSKSPVNILKYLAI